MIGRRALLLGTPLILAAGEPIPEGDGLRFRIMRKGSAIGTHTLAFETAGDALTVRIAADISIGLGPISFFRYRHRATERWVGGSVVSLDAETDDNGTQERATIRREAAGLVVEGTKSGRYLAPPEALPATHWNRRMLDGPMVNTQDGRLMHPVITRLGPRRLEGPRPITADAISLRGDADFDTFYDARPTWVGLRFTAKDGSVVVYERT